MIHSWLEALRLRSLTNAYAIVVNQSKGLAAGSCLPSPPALCCALQMWLHRRLLLLAQTPGTNCCFLRLRYVWTLRTDPNHYSPAKALRDVEARGGEGARASSFTAAEAAPGIVSCLSGCSGRVSCGGCSVSTSMAAEAIPLLHPTTPSASLGQLLGPLCVT